MQAAVLGFADTDHFHKTILCQIQYGGSFMPFVPGAAIVADFFSFMHTGMPMELFSYTSSSGSESDASDEDGPLMSLVSRAVTTPKAKEKSKP